MPEEEIPYETQYEKQDHINNKTYTRKRVYDETPYLVLPSKKFYLKFGDTGKVLKFFIKKLGDEFGDPMPFKFSEGDSIKIFVYNNNGSMEFMNDIVIEEENNTGELEYKFQRFDFKKPGIYYFEIELKNEESSWILGNVIKNEIIVK